MATKSNSVGAPGSNLWHVSQTAYEQAKKQTTDQSIYSKGKKAPYFLIEGGAEDIKKVVDLYQRCEVPGFAVTKVEVIYNKTLVQGFEARIQLLEQRHDNEGFHSKWKKETKEKPLRELRERIDYTLQSEVQKYAVANRHVKVLPMFHGTNKKLFDSIFRTGFDNLATTDSGYFGKGLYNTSYAEYAWRVYSTGGLLFNWVAFYSAFPVIQQDMKHLIGAAKYQNYDAHFALVRPMNPNSKTEKVYLPISHNDKPVYDELVVFESAQVLPRYVVTLSPAGLKVKEVENKPNKSSLIQAISVLWKKAKPSIQEPLQNKLNAVKEEQRLGEEVLTKEEEWLHEQIAGILENEHNQDTDIAAVLTDQMMNLLQISNKSNPVASPETKEQKSPRGESEQNTKEFIPNIHSPKVKVLPPVPSKSPLSGAKTDLETLYNQANQYFSEKKEAEAFKYWKLAADKGHADAQCQVGMCYKLGRGTNKDYKLAVEYCQKAADQGQPDAQDYIGHCYYNGLSLPKDVSKAIELFKKAAAKGNVSSQMYLAFAYDNGTGVEQNDKESFRYWKLAADQGNSNAEWQVALLYKTGKGTQQNYSLALEYGQKAADQGNPDAQDYIGHCYFNGYSVVKDRKKAVEWFLKAAAQGNASSQEYLGDCYSQGNGTETNLVEAAKYYQLAADQNRKNAQYAIGYCYKEGVGVAQDLTKAKQYLTLAAEQGVEKANEHLALLK